MDSSTPRLLLVTGATGLVGSDVVRRALDDGIPVRVLVRDADRCGELTSRGAELIAGDVTDRPSLERAAAGVTHVVHCAAKVGDWGPVEAFRDVNVRALQALVEALTRYGTLQRFVHISSLGVYSAKDHYGTDEHTLPSAAGIDGYTLSKVEAEQVVQAAVKQHSFPAVVLRPGFIYGPGDRSVLPRLLERLRAGQFRYLGDRSRLMNNTYVGNLVDAIWLALKRTGVDGEIFNIADGRLVTKEEFVGTVCDLAGLPRPQRTVPLGIAKLLATVLESLWRMRGKQQAPILSRARIKFLGLNLDFSIDHARRRLGYNPGVDFQQGMAATFAAGG